jgi:TfoX/Sxy family transcriptional regulator of competence genes
VGGGKFRTLVGNSVGRWRDAIITEDSILKPGGQNPRSALDWYERLVATHPGVERKGAKLPYTSLNGHMFSFLTETGTLALRLPEEERRLFVEKYRTAPVVQHGAVMKEYVEVPEDLLRRTQELMPYFERSYDYVAALKPKPGKGAKKSKLKGKSPRPPA